MWRNVNTDRPLKTVLYTRARCCLCDVAEQLLRAHGLSPTLVDVDSDESLRNKFDTTVPVVEINGRIRFRGRIHPLLLRRILVSEQM